MHSDCGSAGRSGSTCEHAPGVMARERKQADGSPICGAAAACKGRGDGGCLFGYREMLLGEHAGMKTEAAGQ